jgi:hypothetical protein
VVARVAHLFRTNVNLGHLVGRCPQTDDEATEHVCWQINEERATQAGHSIRGGARNPGPRPVVCGELARASKQLSDVDAGKGGDLCGWVVGWVGGCWVVVGLAEPLPLQKAQAREDTGALRGWVVRISVLHRTPHAGHRMAYAVWIAWGSYRTHTVRGLYGGEIPLK